MACHECIYSAEDDCNPNNYICHCMELFESKPNEHFLHILQANHSCMQSTTKQIIPEEQDK